MANWKHMNPKSLDEGRRFGMDPEMLRFLMLTKNPYSWVVSMSRNAYHLSVRGRVDHRPLPGATLAVRKTREHGHDLGIADAYLLHEGPKLLHLGSAGARTAQRGIANMDISVKRSGRA
jgi:hypothetical protein